MTEIRNTGKRGSLTKNLSGNKKLEKNELWTSSTFLSVLIAALIRFATSVHAHSGQGKKPMYGDYEAQRHWMEITVNLDVSNWYRNSTDNDLLYWGLDYPPLTAYHSYINGKVGQAINSSYTALFTSRGLESSEHKTFMRSTVFIADFLVFFTSVMHYFRSLLKSENILNSSPVAWLTLSIIYPGLILIDHAHFQYNCVSLGLTIFAISFLFSKNILKSAFFFCLALNYKQMSLYHALPFFIYMLSISCSKKHFYKKLLMLVQLGLVVVSTFAIIWFPFIIKGNAAFDVLHRIFPVARGIFEDKVANIWCAINVIYKLKQLPPTFLIRQCIAITISFSIPSLFCLFKYPNSRQFLLSLINVSLAFFLFSFQVHEKTILLVAVPVVLYAPFDPIAAICFLGVSYMSLLHLALKDNIIFCYLALGFFFVAFLTHDSKLFKPKQSWTCWFILLSLFIYIVIFIGLLFITPPTRYPDLWPLLLALFSCGQFCLFFIYFNWVQFFGSLQKLHV